MIPGTGYRILYTYHQVDGTRHAERVRVAAFDDTGTHGLVPPAGRVHDRPFTRYDWELVSERIDEVADALPAERFDSVTDYLDWKLAEDGR